MFTGLVEGTARVQTLSREGGGARLVLELGPLAEGLAPGASVAVAGCCLTVVGEPGPATLFELSPETLAKTRLGSVVAGDRLNVERSLRAGDPLGGHLVTGHVDGVGRVEAVSQEGDYAEHIYRAPEEVAPYLVQKGSVTVEGVSLTVAELRPDGAFTVALIPETLARTTLLDLRPGDPLHMEGDLLGKYVLRYMAAAAEDPGRWQALLRQVTAAPAEW